MILPFTFQVWGLSFVFSFHMFDDGQEMQWPASSRDQASKVLRQQFWDTNALIGQHLTPDAGGMTGQQWPQRSSSLLA